MSASNQPESGGSTALAGQPEATLAKRGLDLAMQRSLLPMAIALVINYLLAVAFHAMSLPDPGAMALLVLTTITAVAFATSAVWFRLRLPPPQHAPTIAGLFGLLVIFNITVHYWLTAKPVFTSQFIVVVIVGCAVILSRRWTTIFVTVLVAAWAVSSSTFFVTADWVEYSGYLAASTALAIGLNVARRRMVTRLEAAKHAAEAGQEALRRAEADLREIIEKAPDGVLIHRDGEILYANPALASYLRARSAKALVGRALASLIHAEHREAAQDLLETGTSSHDQATHGFIRADGERVMLEIGSTRAIRFQGAPAVLITARDVTARNEEMQARLLLADRMAAVGTVAAGVAHEINNPLAFVIDNLAAMAEEIGPPPEGASDDGSSNLAQLLDDSRHGVERIRRIVRGLKAFSRADVGSVELLDVAELIKSALHIASSEVRQRAHVVENYQPALTVRGDGARLGQVILNLVINAAHAIEEGHVEDNTIALSTTTDADGNVVITVRDSGGGISPDHQDRIFDPFFTTKPVGVGTGLGLYFCHSVVVSELGGQISVDSQLGEGTTFRVVLPPAATDTAADAAEQEAPSAEQDDGGGLDVLILDDEPQVGRALGRILKEHRVTVLTSPTRALAELDGADFDVILCDVMMPEMSGRQVFEKLAAARPGMERRIAFMTGGAFTASANAFLDEVDNPVLDKPVDHHTLRRVIREVAQQNASEGA